MNTAFSRWRSRGLQRLREACTWSGSVLPLAGIVAVGWALADPVATGLHPILERPASGSVLYAGGGVPDDWDRDALEDEQEFILGTSPYLADSDGDSYNDVEELARRSDPTLNYSRPLPTDLDMGMTARGQDGELRIVVAIYVADGVISDKYLEVGFLASGRLLRLPPSEYLPSTVTKLVPAASPNGQVFLLDIPFDPAIVHQSGAASVFATLSEAGNSTVLAASSVDLASVDGIPTLKKLATIESPILNGGGGLATAGSVYIPISTVGGVDIPATWAEGEICYQQTITAGIYSGIITHEVISAECLGEWDARCRSDCASTVGESFQTFDPLGLIGG